MSRFDFEGAVPTRQALLDEQYESSLAGIPRQQYHTPYPSEGGVDVDSAMYSVNENHLVASEKSGIARACDATATNRSPVPVVQESTLVPRNALMNAAQRIYSKLSNDEKQALFAIIRSNTDANPQWVSTCKEALASVELGQRDPASGVHALPEHVAEVLRDASPPELTNALVRKLQGLLVPKQV